MNQNILIVVLLAMLLVAGCAPVPKTRHEFVDAVAGGAAFMRHDSFVSDKSYDSVVSLLAKKSQECLSISVKGSVMIGNNLTVNRSTYHPSIERHGKKVEFTLKVNHLPRPTREPEEGLFLVAADIARKGKQAQVELYGPSIGYGGVTDAIHGWLSGKDLPCPHLN
jgi:hypothetical protein